MQSRLILVVVLLLEIGDRAIDLTAQAGSQQDFEVASIKRSEPGNLRGSTFEFLPGGGLRIANGTLRAILETAYDVREFQILGGPGWVNSERYDILARSADSLANGAGATNDVKAVRLRLRALLRQRFNLEVHRETRELPEYVLEVAKKGPKLIQDDASNGTNNARTGIQRSCGQMIGTNTTVANLSLMLARQLDRPVLDRTGLTGKYNFQFAWTPDTGPCSGSPESSNAPSIFTALEDTLGLRLESMKGPVDTLIIDRAERPSEN
jgi:bla regulator protein blaR1